MSLYVEGGDMQQVRVVAEQAQPVVAPLAQEPADRACRMVVIKMLWCWITTDRTPVVLGRPHLVDSVPGELVATIEVRGAV
jgi:hypothetical protein